MPRLRPEALTWREVEGEIVALDRKRSEYVAVNGTGVLLWRRLVDGAPREELAALLAEQCGLPADRAAADTDAFLDELAAQDLLVHDPE